MDTTTYGCAGVWCIKCVVTFFEGQGRILTRDLAFAVDSIQHVRTLEPSQHHPYPKKFKKKHFIYPRVGLQIPSNRRYLTS